MKKGRSKTVRPFIDAIDQKAHQVKPSASRDSSSCPPFSCHDFESASGANSTKMGHLGHLGHAIATNPSLPRILPVKNENIITDDHDVRPPER